MQAKAASGGECRTKLRPFLRWAGGKQQILHELVKRLPPDVGRRTYREPFLGAASLFFAVQPNKAFLSDANEHLVGCYEYVRDDPWRVAAHLQQHAKHNSRDYYLDVRKQYNQVGFSAAQAARFIYLNRTCFNGIFRVNQNGKFNVPYGNKDKPAIPSRDDLLRASVALRTATLVTADFEKALGEARAGAFVYLDPPYPALNGTAYFTHYTPDKFDGKDQERLASVVAQLDHVGCLIMLSNADTDLIRRLYRSFCSFRVPVIRYITCKAVRHKVQELVITNYEAKV